jgi:7-carboxy-7-deazaguanine synthase
MRTVIEREGPKVRRFNYSEIFGKTFQGEGHYTGVPTVWIRFWGCNFNCSGFGQENPEDPSSWVLDYENLDETQYTSMEELPVFHRGCDSSYSWAKKFASLARRDTAEGIVKQLRDLLPGRTWIHPKSGQPTHLAFTGGEPLMSQTAVVDIMNQFKAEGEVPTHITFETNGTQALRQPIYNLLSDYVDDYNNEVFWSVSPKLYLSGERWDDAIKPSVVKDYNLISYAGQLKYVCNGTQRNWDEVERATEAYRNAGIEWPVWIMPVGADREMQESHQAKIAEEACERGYNVAARVHTWVFGNVIGK